MVTNKTRGGGCLIAVKCNIRSRRISNFEVGQEDIWIAVDHVDGSKTFFNAKYINCKSKLPAYNVHLGKINEIMNDVEPNANFLLCGDYNLEGSITGVRRSDVDHVCVATNQVGEIPQAIVEMQSLTDLQQFNHVKNVNDRSLDLVLSNVDSSCRG